MNIQNEMLIPHARSSLEASKRAMEDFEKGEGSIKEIIGSLAALNVALYYKSVLV